MMGVLTLRRPGSRGGVCIGCGPAALRMRHLNIASLPARRSGLASVIALVEIPQVCSLKFLTCEHRSV